MWLCLVLLLGGVPGAFSQDAPPTAPSTETKIVEKPVMLGDKVLFHLATEAEGLAQANRAEESSRRIRKMADSATFGVDAIKTQDYKGPMTFILAGDEVLTAILDRDAASKGKSRQQLADEYVQILRAAIEKYRKERSIEQHLYGAAYAVIATILLVAVLILIGKLKRKINRRIEERFTGWKKGLHIQSFEIVRADKISELLKGCGRGIRLILVLICLYIYLQFVLGFFPLTRPIADQVFAYVLSPLKTIGKGFILQIPNLIFIAILVLLVKYVLKLMKIFFLGVERERIKLPGFYPEWARSTYRLSSYLVIAFSVVIAFPYIPGSNSMAFKGVSVFIGVLLSLGSQSAISNVIAGFALTYRRVFRVGDRVRISETTGDVLETRLQVTILRTVKNEEIIVPNSLIMNSQVANYSVESRDRGLILHTTVSIGYDTPWRQVQAMLLMAARRTPGLLDKPEAFVLQESLDDFYVTYELNVYTDQPEKMAHLYSELHKNILDVFNDYGVQIMSPNYVTDRAEPAIVPKERWYAPPAKPPDEVQEDI